MVVVVVVRTQIFFFENFTQISCTLEQVRSDEIEQISTM